MSTCPHHVRNVGVLATLADDDVELKVAIDITFINLNLLFNKDFDNVQPTSGGNVPSHLRGDGNVQRGMPRRRSRPDNRRPSAV